MPGSPSLPKSSTNGAAPLLGLTGPAIEYLVDAAQRNILFWDVMRQRGNQYREHTAPKQRRMS